MCTSYDKEIRRKQFIVPLWLYAMVEITRRSFKPVLVVVAVAAALYGIYVFDKKIDAIPVVYREYLGHGITGNVVQVRIADTVRLAKDIPPAEMKKILSSVREEVAFDPRAEPKRP
ncbi:MAG TPA: hypothetical protein VGE35_03225 [Candidatus Paceibacterota bacterium]